MCSLLVNVLLGNTECSVVGDTACFSVVVIIWCCEGEFYASLLENMMLVQSLMNVFAVGECVARIYWDVLLLAILLLLLWL